MNLDKFDNQMELAWESHLQNRNDAAFERLYCAVMDLAEECDKADKGNKRTADIASCLANGIQPD